VAGDEENQFSILEHCRIGSSLSPLIDVTAPKSTLYRAKDDLLKAGLLESDGKDHYKTTSEGLLKLAALKAQIPKGLTVQYPPLMQVPTPQHRALIELTVAAVIARKFNLRSDRHPTIIISGPTLYWKTSLGIFLCHMLNLDHNIQVVNLAAESGKSLWLRKTSTGAITYKRELLDTPLVVFDEYQSADAESKRLLRIWMDGRKNVAVDNEKVTIEATPIITLNPTKGESLEERLGVSTAQLRRSITCDLTGINLPQDLAVKGEGILTAAKNHQPLNLTKPQHDLTKYRAQIYELFLATLNEQGQELADLEMLAMLSTAMTTFLDPVEAIRLVFFDTLLLFETLGWVKDGWMIHVKNFPTGTQGTITSGFHSKTISDETWAEAFKFLDEGHAPTELVTQKHLPPDTALLITKKHNELKEANEKKPGKENKTEDPKVLRLQKDVTIAELERKKAEQKKPFEVDRRISDQEATLQSNGRWKRENCNHLDHSYCMGWQYEQKPNVPFQIGEPLLHTDGKWHIRPTFTHCATCPIFVRRGTRTHDDLSNSLTELEKAHSYLKDEINDEDYGLYYQVERVDNRVSMLEENGKWKRNNCVHYNGDVCKWWHWPNEVAKWSMMKDGDKWRIRVLEHPAYCATCPDYTKKT
jgi:hypothetical protein